MTFDEFVRSDVAERAAAAAALLETEKAALLSLKLEEDEDEDPTADLRVHAPEVADKTRSYLAVARERRDAAAEACTLMGGWPTLAELAPSPRTAISGLAQEVRAEAVELTAENPVAARAGLVDQIRELQARMWLAGAKDSVLAELARLRRRKRYDKCVESTQTRGITNKGAELTKKLVSEAMATAFARELTHLDVARVGVHLGTEPKRGALLHEVKLDGQARDVPPQRVLSEGECRCVALAAFLAELSTANHASGIVFDDPVSSLDHMRRRRVARRLVEEARVRQVSVFTHDLAFLLLLKEHAEANEVPLFTQQVRALRDGPGICQPGLPWAGMNVKERIARLNDDVQSLATLHKNDDVDAYEREAKAIYGRLREAWERGVEEVLLNGVVQRFERGISTKPLKDVVVTEDDLRVLELGMTKTSRWLVGHDDAPELNEPVPLPEEVRADVAALADWVKAIRKRREKR